MTNFIGYHLATIGIALDKLCTHLGLPTVPPPHNVPPLMNGRKAYGLKTTYDHIIYVMEQVGCPTTEFKGYDLSRYAMAFQSLVNHLQSIQRIPDNFF